MLKFHYIIMYPGEVAFIFVNRGTESRSDFKKLLDISFLPVDFFLFSFHCINARRMEIKFFQALEIRRTVRNGRE